MNNFLLPALDKHPSSVTADVIYERLLTHYFFLTVLVINALYADSYTYKTSLIYSL